MEVLPGESAQASYARVLAGGFDLVRHVEDESERLHPRPPCSVGPDCLQNLLVIDTQLAPCQLGGHGTVQELRALPLRIAYLQAPFIGQPQKLLRPRLA